MRFEEIQAMPKAWTLLSILPGLLLMFGALREGVAEGVVPLPLVLLAVALTLIFGLWFRRLRLITEVDDNTVTSLPGPLQDPNRPHPDRPQREGSHLPATAGVRGVGHQIRSKRLGLQRQR
jgi:hypothetical protein